MKDEEGEKMDQEKIGNFIAKLRKENNLTQKELGEKLNITDNSVSKWERGINAPDISQLERISNIFHITTSELLKGERSFQKYENEKIERVLEVKKLTKQFKKSTILKNINFEIYEEEIVGLIGPNGAGKTTLMKCITSLYKNEEGKVEICGYDTRYHLEEALMHTGSIIDSPALYENLSGSKNLDIVMMLKKVKDKKQKEEILKKVNLEKSKNQKVKKYSLGMKQRLALAEALINKPKLLILDEPTNGLDPVGIKDLRYLLKDLSRKEKTAILISSHNLAEIENICDRILLLDKGKMIEDFGIEKVKYQHISLEEEFMNQVGGENA